MNRKEFIRTTGLLVCAPSLFSFKSTTNQKADYLMTVNGAVPINKTGLILPHEHILVDFIGADKVTPSRYDADIVFAKTLPYLEQIVRSGCNTLVECTPAYLSRDVKLLQRLSKASGLHIITNTGYYGAGNGKYLPPHTYSESAGQLAARWTREWEEGIEGTNIRPGFIKIGVDAYPLSEVQHKLVEAAALTHLNTGLTIAIHTGNGEAALEEMKILKNKGVRPEAWIWTHAQNENDRAVHLQVAKEGGWVSFDGLNTQSVREYIQFLKDMKEAQMLHKVLISHDAGWYHVGEPDGGNFRPFDTVFKDLIPALEKEKFTEKDIDKLFRKNPARALAVSIRKA